MASLSNAKNGCRTIQFVGAGKRQTVRLGKMPKKQAEAVKGRIEFLVAASVTGQPIDGETARWVASLDDTLHEKLSRVGLVPARQQPEPQQPKESPTTLAAFLDDYISARTDMKHRTRDIFTRARGNLVGYFGADKPLAEITAWDARKWRLQMLEKGGVKGKPLAVNTVNDRSKKARQMFAAAIEAGHIEKNPFAGLPGTVRSNREKFYFVTREETARLLETAPDGQWRLLIALCRFGGLRNPSETLKLRWEHIDWQRGRMTVLSPKTEHHEGKESRVVPLFPELLPYLEEAWELSEPGAEFVVTFRRDAEGANLRTRMLKIIQRAGLKPWPRVFHNLRATRQTELENEFPTHVVCEWLGNSESVAREHYLRVTDEHFAKASGGALQNALHSGAALSGMASQSVVGPAENAGKSQIPRHSAGQKYTRRVSKRMA